MYTVPTSGPDMGGSKKKGGGGAKQVGKKRKRGLGPRSSQPDTRWGGLGKNYHVTVLQQLEDTLIPVLK